MKRPVHPLFPSAIIVAIMTACYPTPTEDESLPPVPETSVSIEDTVIEGLVAAWTAGAPQGTPLVRSTYADVLEANLREAFLSMNEDPRRFGVVLSRAEPGKESEVSLVERDAELTLVFGDGVDSCEIRDDAGWRDKIRWGNCIDDLAGGGGGRGICMKMETVREAGDDGEFGTDDDIFVTTCTKRNTLF